MDTSKNLFPHKHFVDANLRRKLTKQKPILIWLSGLSGSGKSTLIRHLNNYSNFHVCLSICHSIISSMCPKTSSNSFICIKNVTYKSCLVCVKSQKYACMVHCYGHPKTPGVHKVRRSQATYITL